LEKGLTTHAAEALATKLDGNYAGGVARLQEKDAEWVKSFNKSSAPKPQPTSEASDPKDNGKQW
jgi:hypothetical protein